MEVKVLGAAGEVTGSCYLVRAGERKLLLDCGLIQGKRADDRRNRDPLPFSVDELDAIVLSHAHVDHSGRIPLLSKLGYQAPVYSHHATRALCEIMLRDSAYLHEKDAEWENRKRRRKGLQPIEPLYTRGDAENALSLFRSFEYDEFHEIFPGLKLRFRDAGHILGAAIVELWFDAGAREHKLVFSGDLGYTDAPIMEDPTLIEEADLLLLESTYGDRNHRSFEDTLAELESVFLDASVHHGNILIPAFAVGRTQDLLYLMSEYYDQWRLSDWRVYLDSPMAIEATSVYSRYRYLYGAQLFRKTESVPELPNFRPTPTSADSMRLNEIESGAIIIAGSGMCSGGRILHHLKHNLWRSECHVIIVGFQAEGTLGRKLVDGARYVRLWQETIRVNASIHTVGGLSAHADQSGLLDWYAGFRRPPRVCLIHGEDSARAALARKLSARFGVTPALPVAGETVPVSAG